MAVPAYLQAARSHTRAAPASAAYVQVVRRLHLRHPGGEVARQILSPLTSAPSFVIVPAPSRVPVQRVPVRQIAAAANASK
eukprot:s935_g1.t1